jgi:hypothetical protein
MQAHSISQFIYITGSTYETALAYLIAEEWSVSDAVQSYNADKQA